MDIPSIVDTNKRNPILWTWNGIGFDLFGRMDLSEDLWIKIHCFCFIYIPIIPISTYLVNVSDEDLNPVEGTTFSVYGKVGLFKLTRTYGLGSMLKLAFTAFIEGIGKIIVLVIILAMLTALGYCGYVLFN